MKNIILIFVALLISLSSISQERLFRKVLEENSIEAYEKFIKKYPSSEFTEGVSFKKAELINTPKAYDDFIKKYPQGDFKNRALDLWSTLEFKRVTELYDLSEYENFLKKFPNSEFEEQVKKNIEIIKFEIAKKIEKLEFESAKLNNTVTAYDYFLNKYPDGTYTKNIIDLWTTLEIRKAEEIQSIEEYKILLQTLENYSYGVKIRKNIEDREYTNALKKNTVIAFQSFLNKFPSSVYSAEAKREIFDLEFQNVIEKKSFELFNSFFEQHPELPISNYEKAIHSLGSDQKYNISSMNSFDSKFSNYAKEYYETIRLNEVTDSYDLEKLKAFVKDYPKCKGTNLLKKRISSIKINNTTSGENIFDLIYDHKVEIEVSGSDITRVLVKMRKLVPNKLNVQVPPGTFFISNNSSSQNMVTRRNKNIVLADNGWHEFNIDASCANRILNIPGSEDRFSVQRSPNQVELEILMKVLSKENTTSAVEQAAIWIVTDNADYDDLGILVMRSMYSSYGGTRVMNEFEAARAMQICEKAGINIKAKAIWGDTETILSGLKSSSLKTWLQNYTIAD